MRLFRLTAPASVHVESVCYVQNLALWYSFAVKRQTMLMREKGVPDAAARYERRLFHGCPAEMVSKIVEQGFNRSFTGATSGRASFGKGVYFARDARKSMCPEYSPPDANGVQHVFLVRAVVGEFCKGKKDALTPTVRCENQLYDSTVDDVDNPSIFVTYNDSQVYPDILIKFTM
jgi:poly [ADP-ribose] polymerase 10/14/15